MLYIVYAYIYIYIVYAACKLRVNQFYSIYFKLLETYSKCIRTTTISTELRSIAGYVRLHMRLQFRDLKIIFPYKISWELYTKLKTKVTGYQNFRLISQVEVH